MNIFAIDNWAGATFYRKNSIVAFPDDSTTYWYAMLDHTGGLGPSVDNPNWGGYANVGNGTMPQFIWVPSYSFNQKMEPKIKQIQFGDGYKQTVKDGINNVLLELDLSFDQRDAYESAAICHFLTAREGAETFLFTPPSPYAALKKWKSTTWNISQPFFANYSVKATFMEVLI